MPRRLLAIALIVVGAGACGKSGAPAAPVDSTATFVAFSSTFADFRTRPSFHSDGPPDDRPFPTDVLGPRTQYLDRLPPHGATEFPIGTVIVEENVAPGKTGEPTSDREQDCVPEIDDARLPAAIADSITFRIAGP